MAELTTLARPYAKAVFGLAGDARSRAAWSDSLAVLANVVVHDQVRELLGNPRVDREKVVELICTVAGKALDEEGRNLVRLLAANRRLALVPQIAAIYERLRAEAENVIDVDVISSAPLEKAQQDKLSRALKKRLGREVRLHCQEDENIVGGAVIRAGDLVIDGSVRGQLERLSGALVH